MVKIDLIATGDTPGDVIAALRLLALGEAAPQRQPAPTGWPKPQS